MSYHYGVPPAHYQKFQDYSPSYNQNDYVHYYPSAYNETPTKRQHARKHSHAESPRVGGFYSPAGSPPPYPDAYAYYTPRKEAYVSYDSRAPPVYGMPPTYTQTPRKQSHPVQIYDDDGVAYAEPLPKYSKRNPIPPPKMNSSNKHGKKPSTDSYFYFHQGQVYDEQPKRTRARASTGTSRPSPKHKASPSTSVPQATEKDAVRAGIPSGYSIKNWDPTEKPIILLGSVFDANALGKWIYDWTVFHHGASTPMADMAGDLWLLLIKLAGKMKRAEECVKRIRNPDSKEMIEDFLSSGARLWEKFKQLLKDCEYYMMKAAKKEGSKTMGKNAGTEFVDSIFGRERYLEQSEKIMTNIRLWNMRFDVNCEDILRRPSAA